MITFTVPGQPYGKGRPRVGRVAGHARLFTPEKTVSYEGLVATVAQSVMAGRPLIAGPARVVLDILCPIPASWSKRKRAQALDGHVLPTTKPDIDNVEKSIFDGLNGVVWRDDVQVVEVTKRKLYAETPGVVVSVVALPSGATR